ncbi:unnamed protein product [Paramecium octaurelia]|uniref:Uncharacterized protein n=1 Tax=Paramecium octaurelia TaxID=43137 RepID=A0A8S1YIV8_PAROT|nr:unnamed protein product [Paramecium octaurelia]CAD8214716.1 unnamed protein product [Paramecium octaurelia]
MKLFLLFFLLKYSDFASLPVVDANVKCSQNDLYILRKASIIRGNYRDVASQFNGALIPSARAILFHVSNIDNSPLRNSLYPHYIGDLGHVDVYLRESVIVRFLSINQINTVRFWMWDNDNRQTEMQVFVITADLIEKVIFDGIAKSTLYVLKFSDQLASGLKFYNKGGNNLDHTYMTILKIQAFQAF